MLSTFLLVLQRCMLLLPQARPAWPSLLLLRSPLWQVNVLVHHLNHQSNSFPSDPSGQGSPFASTTWAACLQSGHPGLYSCPYTLYIHLYQNIRPMKKHRQKRNVTSHHSFDNSNFYHWITFITKSTFSFLLLGFVCFTFSPYTPEQISC